VEFLILIIILEALAKKYENKYPDEILCLIGKWKESAKEMKKTLEEDREKYKESRSNIQEWLKYEQYQSLLSIEGKLKYLETNSLIDQIRKMIKDSLRIEEPEFHQSYKNFIDKLYSIRSVLTHGKELSKKDKEYLENNLMKTRYMVQSVLKSQIKRILEQ
jgi:hypothetical protein